MVEEPDPNNVNTFFTAGPAGEPVEVVSEVADISDLDNYDPRHPPDLSEVAAEAFTDFESSAFTPGEDADPSSMLMQTNFSQAGYVHLPPVDSPSRRSQSLASSKGRGTRHESPSIPGSSELDIEAYNSGDAQRGSITSGSTSPVGSGAGSAIESGSGSGSEGPHVTFRYQHIQDDDGHHLIVGREGKLTRCEDEVGHRHAFP